MSRLAACLFLAASFGAFAADPEYKVAIENHRFVPDRIEIPAGQKVRLLVDNKDPTPEEFESNELKIEKVIPGKSRATVFVGPLKPGEYKFFGEFNEKTAQGVIVAK